VRAADLIDPLPPRQPPQWQRELQISKGVIVIEQWCRKAIGMHSLVKRYRTKSYMPVGEGFRMVFDR
jgi:hypothetical protein